MNWFNTFLVKKNVLDLSGMTGESTDYGAVVPSTRRRGLAENSRGQMKRFWVECDDDPHQCHVYGFVYANDEGKGVRRFTCSRCAKKQRYSKAVTAVDENGKEVVYERTEHGPECRFPISNLVNPTSSPIMELDDFSTVSPSVSATPTKIHDIVDKNSDVDDQMDGNCSVYNDYQPKFPHTIELSEKMVKVRKPSSTWLEKACECLKIPPVDDAYSIWSQITIKVVDLTEFPMSFQKMKEFGGSFEAGFAAISYWLTGTGEHKHRIRNELNKLFFDNFKFLGMVDGKDFGTMKHTDQEFKDVIFADEMRNAHLATVSRLLGCTVIVFDAYNSQTQVFDVGQREEGPTILLGKNKNNYFVIFSF
uniref:Uncharacterized protein n=1 Tax=Panagrolaimus sp. JU765 TaxID=591449 RepID=A0AC34R8R3_9BILA